MDNITIDYNDSDFTTESYNIQNTTEFTPDPIPTSRIVLGAFLFIFVATTFGANLFVFVSFILEKKIRTVFTALVANLAFADTLVAITAMDFYTINLIYGYWPFGKILCGIWVVFDYNLVFVSSWSLAAIALDRMWSITWSIHYRHHNNMKKAAGMIVFVWSGVFSIVMYPIISDRVLRTKQYHCEFVPAENPHFVIILAVLGHHFPCFIIVSCSLTVYIQMKKLVRNRPSKNNTANKNEKSAGQKKTLWWTKKGPVEDDEPSQISVFEGHSEVPESTMGNSLDDTYASQESSKGGGQKRMGGFEKTPWRLLSFLNNKKIQPTDIHEEEGEKHGGNQAGSATQAAPITIADPQIGNEGNRDEAKVSQTSSVPADVNNTAVESGRATSGSARVSPEGQKIKVTVARVPSNSSQDQEVSSEEFIIKRMDTVSDENTTQDSCENTKESSLSDASGHTKVDQSPIENGHQAETSAKENFGMNINKALEDNQKKAAEEAEKQKPVQLTTQESVSNKKNVVLVVPDTAESVAAGISGGKFLRFAKRRTKQKVSNQRQEKERRTFITLFYIVVAYVVTWVPFHIIYDLSFIIPNQVPQNAFTYLFWITYVNSTVNPFLYAFTSFEIRGAIKKIITCHLIRMKIKGM